MTLPRLFALYAVWKKYPPVIVAAAAMLGVKSDDAAKVPETREEVAEAMAAAAIRVAQATTADPSKLRWITVPNPNRMS
jgi:hypothetical protein